MSVLNIETEFEKKNREKSRQAIEFRRFVTWRGNGSFIQPYLGCDIGFVREWLENMFVEGMTWENYGSVWVVDHIVPFRMFDIFNEDELKICWNYRNLMPLLKEDNLKKEGNVFFAIELLYPRKDKDSIYKALFERVVPEGKWMIKYIDNYDSKPFK
jgi:hypothetical protein